MIRAFRDTWELGIHSYLTYLRDRLLLARELLHESGSCFVQIWDENVHHVREADGRGLRSRRTSSRSIVVREDGGVGSSWLLKSGDDCDYLVWYAQRPRARQVSPALSSRRALGWRGTAHVRIGSSRPTDETSDDDAGGDGESRARIPQGARIFRLDNLTSSGRSENHAAFRSTSKARSSHPGRIAAGRRRPRD